jgi:hypothetical protein
MSGLLVAAQHHAGAGRQMTVPYVTAWSEEVDPPCVVVERPGTGIAYADETVTDRDHKGVLWYRTPHWPGQGRPNFGQVHPARQRRAMQRLLCQVCAGPADQTEDGVLWLLRDFRKDWPSWPNGMGVTEPPICLPCVRVSTRLCTALRRGAVLVRAGSFVVRGVHGLLYQRDGGKLKTADGATVAFDAPAIQWIRAVSLVRELQGCDIIHRRKLSDEAA